MSRIDNARTVALRLDPVRTLHAQKNLDRLDAFRAKNAERAQAVLETQHQFDNATLEELPALLREFDREYIETNGARFTPADFEAAQRGRDRLQWAVITSATIRGPSGFEIEGSKRFFFGSMLVVVAGFADQPFRLERAVLIVAGLILLAAGAWAGHKQATR
jgi:hypothetical protein